MLPSEKKPLLYLHLHAYSLSVSKVVDAGVLIPMDDGLLENAINSTHNCVDNSGYGVCHIYKIVVTNKCDSVTGISSTLAFNLTNINFFNCT